MGRAPLPVTAPVSMRSAAVLLGGLISAFSSSSAAPIPDRANASAVALPAWDEFRAAIDDFDMVPSCAVSVGDSRGELFRHEKGATTFSTQMGIASATKWVSGVMVMSVVEASLGQLAQQAQNLQHKKMEPNSDAKKPQRSIPAAASPVRPV